MGRIVEMPLPRLGETMEEGRIGQWFKKPGEKFRRGDTLLEVESDKTTVEVPALQDGNHIEWLVAQDQMVPVESAIALIEIEGDAAAEVKVKHPSSRPASPSPAKRGEGGAERAGWGPATSRPRASTAARAAARRANIDLAALSGSGRNGRIATADLAAASRPARATYHVATPHGKIFIREWPAQGVARGTALLIHGLFSDSQSFITLGRMLAAKGLRTLAVDLPGHGETQSAAASLANIVSAIAATLPPVKLHIAGHSFGAIIATHLADRAKSLTLLSPAGCGEEINADFIAAMLGGHVDHALDLLGEKSIPPEVKATLRDHLAVNGGQLREIASAVAEDGKQTVSILTKLAGLEIPVSAVFVRDDAIVPSHHAANLPSNVAVRFLAAASHLPHWRDPELITGLISKAI